MTAHAGLSRHHPYHRAAGEARLTGHGGTDAVDGPQCSSQRASSRRPMFSLPFCVVAHQRQAGRRTRVFISECQIGQAGRMGTTHVVRGCLFSSLPSISRCEAPSTKMARQRPAGRTKVSRCDTLNPFRQIHENPLFTQFKGGGGNCFPKRALRQSRPSINLSKTQGHKQHP